MSSQTGFISRLLAGGICSVVLFVSLSGCGKDQSTPAPEERAMQEGGAVADPYQPGAPLPPNHPPLDGAGESGAPAQYTQAGAENGMLGHPPDVVSSEAKDVEVVVPDNIKGKWTAVQLAIAAGEENGRNELVVPIGGQAEVADGMVLLVDAFLPDYTSDFEKATSASDTLNNPAALVHLMKQDKLVAKGWVFKNYPEFNTFDSSEVKIELLDAASSKQE